MIGNYKLVEKMKTGETVYTILCANFTYYVWPVVITGFTTACGEIVECEVSGHNDTIPPCNLFITKEEAEKLACDLQRERGMKFISQKQYDNMVDRGTLLKRLFPLGVPQKHEMNYAINARAVYEAIMKQ